MSTAPLHKYTCDRCSESFNIQQQYASHRAKCKGHKWINKVKIDIQYEHYEFHWNSDINDITVTQNILRQVIWNLEELKPNTRIQLTPSPLQSFVDVCQSNSTTNQQNPTQNTNGLNNNIHT